ncbi:MAG: hypothetical protein JNN05_03595, partial [Candidatus Omnitrophica bacterium]|nr:hypothetical protein [Candidatus Omnitrophota bacterium]
MSHHWSARDRAIIEINWQKKLGSALSSQENRNSIQDHDLSRESSRWPPSDRTASSSLDGIYFEKTYDDGTPAVTIHLTDVALVYNFEEHRLDRTFLEVFLSQARTFMPGVWNTGVESLLIEILEGLVSLEKIRTNPGSYISWIFFARNGLERIENALHVYVREHSGAYLSRVRIGDRHSLRITSNKYDAIHLTYYMALHAELMSGRSVPVKIIVSGVTAFPESTSSVSSPMDDPKGSQDTTPLVHAALLKKLINQPFAEMLVQNEGLLIDSYNMSRKTSVAKTPIPYMSVLTDGSIVLKIYTGELLLVEHTPGRSVLLYSPGHFTCSSVDIRAWSVKDRKVVVGHAHLYPSRDNDVRNQRGEAQRQLEAVLEKISSLGYSQVQIGLDDRVARNGLLSYEDLKTFIERQYRFEVLERKLRGSPKDVPEERVDSLTGEDFFIRWYPLDEKLIQYDLNTNKDKTASLLTDVYDRFDDSFSGLKKDILSSPVTGQKRKDIQTIAGSLPSYLNLQGLARIPLLKVKGRIRATASYVEHYYEIYSRHSQYGGMELGHIVFRELHFRSGALPSDTLSVEIKYLYPHLPRSGRERTNVGRTLFWLLLMHHSSWHGHKALIEAHPDAQRMLRHMDDFTFSSEHLRARTELITFEIPALSSYEKQALHTYLDRHIDSQFSIDPSIEIRASSSIEKHRRDGKLTLWENAAREIQEYLMLSRREMFEKIKDLLKRLLIMDQRVEVVVESMEKVSNAAQSLVIDASKTALPTDDQITRVVNVLFDPSDRSAHLVIVNNCVCALVRVIEGTDQNLQVSPSVIYSYARTRKHIVDLYSEWFSGEDREYERVWKEVNAIVSSDSEWQRLFESNAFQQKISEELFRDEGVMFGSFVNALGPDQKLDINLARAYLVVADIPRTMNDLNELGRDKIKQYYRNQLFEFDPTKISFTRYFQAMQSILERLGNSPFKILFNDRILQGIGSDADWDLFIETFRRYLSLRSFVLGDAFLTVDEKQKLVENLETLWDGGFKVTVEELQSLRSELENRQFLRGLPAVIPAYEQMIGFIIAQLELKQQVGLWLQWG